MSLILVILLCCTIFCSPCYAAEMQIAEQIETDTLWEVLPEEVREQLAGYDLTTGTGWEAVWEGLKIKGQEVISCQLRSVWRPAVQVLMIVVLCSMFHAVMPGDKQSLPLLLSGGTGIIALTLSDGRSFFQEGVEAVRTLYDFSTALLPCMAGVSVIAGATVSAGVKYTAAALFMNLLLNFTNGVLIPLVSAYLLCVIGDTMFDQRMMGAVADFIRRLCLTVLTGGVVVFTTYLSAAGLMSGAGDLLATRVTKSALSAGLPIVGGIVSDAASTLVAGAAVLRSGIGVFGMLAVLGILLVPFLSMGVRYLLFKAVGELAKLFPNHRFSGLIQGIANAFGVIMAVLGTGVIMIFLTLISFMQIAGGV